MASAVEVSRCRSSFPSSYERSRIQAAGTDNSTASRAARITPWGSITSANWQPDYSSASWSGPETSLISQSCLCRTRSGDCRSFSNQVDAATIMKTWLWSPGGAAAPELERAVHPQRRPVGPAAPHGAPAGSGWLPLLAHVCWARCVLHGPGEGVPGPGGQADPASGRLGRVQLPQGHRALLTRYWTYTWSSLSSPVYSTHFKFVIFSLLLWAQAHNSVNLQQRPLLEYKQNDMNALALLSFTSSELRLNVSVSNIQICSVWMLHVSF